MEKLRELNFEWILKLWWCRAPVTTRGLKCEPKTCNAVRYLTHRAKMLVKMIFTLISAVNVNQKTSSKWDRAQSFLIKSEL